jgi:hypothetical protein
VDDENDKATATAPGKPARSRFWVLVVALVVLAGGAWVLWDMRPTTSPHTDPTARLKVLGRDDQATLREEESLKSRPAAPSATASASPSASSLAR